MKTIILDGAKMTTKKEAHEYIKSMLDFHDEYGENLEGLRESLTTYGKPMDIILNNRERVDENLQEYSQSLINVLIEADQGNDAVKFRVSMTKLFSPFSIKNIHCKNRVVMAPMCMYSAEGDGKIKDWHRIHYATRAAGGVGLIIQEATGVEPRGRISGNDLGIWGEEHIAGLKEMVETCKEYGAVMGIQLGHAGRKCEVLEEDIIAPSPITYSEKYQVPKEMNQEDIQEVIAAFRSAAQRCLDIGYDLIEIHGAHGYLINQFLSPLTNKRTDEYGGSIKNRARLLKEVIIAIREVWPREKPLGLRVTAEDYKKEGNHPDDLVEIINLVKKEGIDIIDVSSGGVVSAPINLYQGYQVRFAEVIKEGTDLPVMAGGLLLSPHMAEEILQNNRADMIFLGRELLRNPYWSLQADMALQDEMIWPKQYLCSKPKR